MFISVGDGEPYPGGSLSISRLLWAARRKLGALRSVGGTSGTALVAYHEVLNQEFRLLEDLALLSLDAGVRVF